MQFTSSVYDVLKKVAQIWLPAAGTLYFALAAIWNLPAAEEVSGTVLAVDTFLGVVLGISKSQYDKSDARFDGVFDVSTGPSGKKTFNLRLEGDPEDLLDKQELAFKVNDPGAS